MDARQMFKETKKTLTELIEQVTLVDFDKCEEGYVKTLSLWKALRDYEKWAESLVLKAPDPGSELAHMDTENKEVPEQAPAKEIRLSYVFERKLKGGCLPKLNHALLTEELVRNLDLKNGDLLYAEPKEGAYGSKPIYWYEVAERRERKMPVQRVGLGFCPVEAVGNFLVVRKSYETGELIRFSEVSMELMLQDNDIREYSLREGDLVDIAYWENAPERPRVVYKHPVPKEVDMVKTVSRKRKDRIEEESRVAEPDLTLEGKVILVVGNDAEPEKCREYFTRQGAEMLWADSKFSGNRLSGLIRKADAVVYLLRITGHGGMTLTKRLCKEYEVPFVPTWSLGASSLLAVAEEAVC